jgi:hypothetical protein
MFTEEHWNEVYKLFQIPVYDSWGILRNDQVELLVNMILVSHHIRIGFIIDKLDYLYHHNYESALQMIADSCDRISIFKGLIMEPLFMIPLSIGTYVCLKTKAQELIYNINEDSIYTLTSLPYPKNDGNILLRVRTKMNGVVLSNWCNEYDVPMFLQWARYVLDYVNVISDNMIKLHVDRYKE